MGTLGERIQIIINIHNINQKKLANSIRITSQHLSSIMNGKENASDTLLDLICEKYNIKFEWLRYGKGDMFQNNDINKLGIALNMFKHLDKDYQNFMIDTLEKLVDLTQKNKNNLT